MQTICITNQKGGCAKTMTVLNLGAGLAHAGKKVLLIDLDPQGPLAPGLGVTPSDDALPLSEALVRKNLDTSILSTSTTGLFVAPGDVNLDAAYLDKQPFRDTVLKRALDHLTTPLDFILLDTPPNLDRVTINAIFAADWLILPGDVDKESLMSLRRTLDVAYQYIAFRDDVDQEEFYRVLVTIYSPQSKVMNTWFDTQIAELPIPPFKTRVHRSDAAKKARAQGLTVFDYSKKSFLTTVTARRAVEDYTNLTKEVLAYATKRATANQRRTARRRA
jgi:chromosome partitioning protein